MSWPYEQHAVGALRRAHDGSHTTVCIPFAEFFGYSPRSFVHHPVYKPADKPGMRAAIAEWGLGTEEAFGAAVDALLASTSMYTLDTVAVQASMAQRTALDPVFYGSCERQCSTEEVMTWFPPP